MYSAASNQVAKLSPLLFAEDEDDVPEPSFANPSNTDSCTTSTFAIPHPRRAALSRTVTDASERLQLVHVRTQEKIQTLRELRDKEMMEECTFTPKLGSVSPPRSFKEFYTCQTVHESSRLEKLERERAAHELDKSLLDQRELSQPEMSPGSRELLKGKHAPTLIQRLAVPKKPPAPAKPPPAPKATKAEIQMIVNRLNASPPTARAGTPLSQVQSLKSAISVRSGELMNTALEREVEQRWKDLELGEQANYLQLEYLLRDMNYVSGVKDKELLYQAWVDLKGEEKGYVRKDTVLSFLSAISGSAVSKEASEETDTSENSALSFAAEPILKAKYQRFIDNRMTVRKKTEVKVPEYTFHPQISSSSQQLLSNRSPTPPKAVRDRSPGAVLKDMMKDCTFRPQVSKRTRSAKVRYLDSEAVATLTQPHRTDLLFLHGKVLLEKKAQVTPIDYEYEKNKSELTFSPQISPRAKTPTASRPPPGYEKVVERMRKANLENERVRYLQTRGVPITRPPASPRLPRSPKGLFSPVLQKKEKQPPDLMQLLMSEEPDLVADLLLPGGKTVQLVVAAGESVEAKLRELAGREGLTEEQVSEYLQSLM